MSSRKSNKTAMDKSYCRRMNCDRGIASTVGDGERENRGHLIH